MPSSRETEIFPHVAFALNLQKLVFIFCLTNDLEIEELKLGLKKKNNLLCNKEETRQRNRESREEEEREKEKKNCLAETPPSTCTASHSSATLTT